MLPISLIVTLDIVKVLQSIYIQYDEYLISTVRHNRAKVMTRSINEELGQVKFIFSDKTGTLTCNKMELKELIVGDL
jgi:P-type E1-E2 ATPase